MKQPIKVGIFGAGAIGGYVGGRLRLAGQDVVLVGRAAFAGEIAAHGLRLTALDGFDRRLAPDELRVATTPDALAGCDVVLVTVKSGDTVTAARALRPIVGASTVVVSFQNGVRNPEVLTHELGARVLAGMVPFNVLRRGPGHLHQGVSGALHIEDDARARPLVDALRSAGLAVRTERDMRAIQWGKLLLNLNNPLNALAGVPLREELASRHFRRVLADCQTEALRALAKAGIRARMEAPLPAQLLPVLLRLPDLLYRLIAATLIRIDPEARSSMWEDLERGRPTEIDSLSGEVVRLANSVGLSAPANETVMQLVREAEGHGSPRLDGRRVRAEITSRKRR
jgi:2-dehydropantoate 2-reductase